MVLVIMIMAQVLGSECLDHKGYSFLNMKPVVAYQLPVEFPMSGALSCICAIFKVLMAVQ
jgi:hypothetical protein